MRALGCFIVVVLSPIAALAYPQFQLSTGNVRCNQCHFAPAGGGLLNPYGRSESEDTIANGGNGNFLHGLWDPPSWLGLGGDFRFAGLVANEGGNAGTDTELFPMQADLYLRLAYEGFSFSGTVGIRGATRPVDPSFESRIISREHYLMWRQGPVGWYVRAGRFYTPYGLRLAEHTAYIRRWLGFNVLEEPYALSGGYISDEWELHLSAYIPDFVRQEVGERGSGGVAYFEKREGKTIAYGAQTKLKVGDDDTRFMGGLVGKIFFEGPKIQLLAEADLVYQTFKHIDAHRWQMAGYLGGAWFPARGFMIQLMLERWDEDIALQGVARDALGAAFQWFPFAHFEVSLYGRLQLIGTGGDDGHGQELLLLQVHYWL